VVLHLPKTKYYVNKQAFMKHFFMFLKEVFYVCRDLFDRRIMGKTVIL